MSPPPVSRTVLEVRFLATPYDRLRVHERHADDRLMVSLDAIGQQFPISVVRDEPQDTWVVVDGHRRVRALRRLGRDVVDAQVVDLPIEQALVWVRVGMTRTHPCAIDEALLIRELHEGQGLSLVQLASMFGRPVGWVSARLGLVRVLGESTLDDVVAGRIPARTAMRVLVPVARDNPDHAVTLAGAIVRGRLTTRDADTLYRHYRQGTQRVRQEILADPLRFLKIDRVWRASQTSVMPALDPRESGLIADMQRLEIQMQAVAAHLRQVTHGGVTSSLDAQIDLAWGALSRTWDQMAQVTHRARTCCHGGNDDQRDRPARSAAPEPGRTRDATDRAASEDLTHDGPEDPGPRRATPSTNPEGIQPARSPGTNPGPVHHVS